MHRYHPRAFAAAMARPLLALAALWMLSTGFAPDAQATTVSAGYQTGCSVSDAGAATCWGMVPLPAAAKLPAARMVDIKTSNGFSCALLGDGAVSCWGAQNEFYQQGYVSPWLQSGAPAVQYWAGQDIGLVRATQIALGARHGCALGRDGAVYCWGDAGQGQMGVPERGGILIAYAVRVQGLADVVRIAAGNGSTCAVHRSGTVSCLGAGRQLGGAGDDPRTPLQVPGISDAVDVSIFDGHACVLRAGGQVACWGRNTSGELGVPASAGSVTTPVAVPDLGGAAKAVSAGYGFTCALLDNGTVRCWGDNALAQAGTGSRTINGTNTPSMAPASGQVIGITNAIAISAGATHACAVLDGGYVNCWGAGAGVHHGLCRGGEAFYPGIGVLPHPQFNSGACFSGTGSNSPYAMPGLGPAKDAAVVMEWAEKAMPQIFVRPGPGSWYVPDWITSYYERIYPGGHHLAVNGHGTPHLMYLGPESGGRLLDLGPLAQWLRLARQ